MAGHQVGILFIDLALIVGIASAAGWVSRALGQPAVIGEIVAGILLGPTLFHGAIANELIPGEVRPHLSTFANVGLALFMFVVGLEFDYTRLRRSGRVAAAVAVGSTVPSFILGCVLAVYLAEEQHPANRLAFVLFVGVALSITAFPVLARILADRGMEGTLVGTVALSAAALCDLAAWTMLAVVQTIAAGGDGDHWTVVLIVPLIGVIFGVIRPALSWLLSSNRGPLATAAHLPVVLTLLMASAAITELIGLHLVFGAFLLGLAVPRRATSSQRNEMRRSVQATTTLLLPVYFVVAGLSVDLSQLGSQGVVDLALITAVAIIGKFAGAFVAARTQGFAPRRSAALATLMNTRGLTEIVVLGVGMQIGVIDHALYSLLMVTAVITTAMAGPLLQLVADRNDHETFQIQPVAAAGVPRV